MNMPLHLPLSPRTLIIKSFQSPGLLSAKVKFAKTYNKEVFCLEGDWNNNLKKGTSVQAVLMFMKQNRDIDYIHRQCGTRENLAYYLKQWQLKRYHKYSILYLAFHGKPNQILVG